MTIIANIPALLTLLSAAKVIYIIEALLYY